MNQIINLKSIVACLIIISVFQTGCSTHRVAGFWPAGPIDADGTDNEWQGAPQYHDPENQAYVRVGNDEDEIYICFSTSNNELKKKMMMTGVTLWIDPKGKKNKTYGIRLSMKPPRPPANFSERDRNRVKGGELPPFKMPEKLAILHADATDPLEMKLEEAARSGVDVGIGQPNGRLVYEYKIKTKGDENVLAVEIGKVLGIGIETGTMGMEQMRRKGGMGGPGGGMRRPGGGMGGRHPGGMKGPGGGRPDLRKTAEPFELWLNVELAIRKFPSARKSRLPVHRCPTHRGVSKCYLQGCRHQSPIRIALYRMKPPSSPVDHHTRHSMAGGASRG